MHSRPCREVAAFGVLSPFVRLARRFEFGNRNDKLVKDAALTENPFENM